MNAVGKRGHGVEARHNQKVLPSEPKDFRFIITCEKPHELGTENEHRKSNQNAIEKFDGQTFSQAQSHTPLILCAMVLRGKRGHCLSDALFRLEAEVVNFCASVECGDCVYSQRVHGALDEQFAHVEDGLLCGGGKAVTDRFPNQGSVYFEFARLYGNQRLFPVDVAHAEEAGNHLCRNRCERRACHAQFEHGNQNKIKDAIEDCADCHADNRRFAVSYGAERGGEHIIKEGKNQPAEHYPKVMGGRRNQFYGGAHEVQNRYGKSKADCAYKQREHKAYRKRRTDFVFQFVKPFCAVEFAYQYARAPADSHDEENHNVHNGVCDSGGGKADFSCEAAKDDGVHGIVGELEKVTEYQGNRKTD